MKEGLRIVVLGGTGYVGVELVNTLCTAGHRVTVVVRSKNAFLAERKGVEIVSTQDGDRIGRSDALVNLAYSAPTDLDDNLRRTRDLFELVTALSAQASRIIHISTQAVFGYDLRFPASTVPLKMRRDHAYVESKLLMENLLLRSDLAAKLRIIRLGNVWGPASPTWTVQLAARLFFQQPVGVRGIAGYSNATEVANVASYILHLIEAGPESRAGIDHLAELGAIRWPQLLEPMARQLGVDPVELPTPLGPETSGWSDFFEASARQLSPKKLGIAFLGGRNTGSLLRRTLERLPAPTLPFIRQRLSSKVGLAPKLAAGDDTLLRILTCQTLFESSVLPGWKPPVDFDGTAQRVAEWIEESGFPCAGANPSFERPTRQC